MLKNLTVNKLLEIESSSSKEKTIYKSRVEEINAAGIWIATPIVKGQLVPLPVGAAVTIYYGDENSVCYFSTFINRRVREPVPMLLLAVPDQDKIVSIQRRDYVRIPVIIPLEFKIMPLGVEKGLDLAEIEINKANTLDLSGGGLRFLTKKEVQYNDLLQLNLLFEGEVLILFGQVTRISKHLEENKHSEAQKQDYSAVGVKFVNIHETDRDKIIKFIFTWQRQMRRKGLL